VHSVRLLISDQSGHNKQSDIPTIKNTDRGDYGTQCTCWMSS